MTTPDPLVPTEVRALMQRHGMRPQKRLGQNFLIDRNVRDRIAASARITPQTPVLEIGTGLGALTLALCDQAEHVLTLEIDRHLLPALDETLAQAPRLERMHADFMLQDTAALLDKAFGVKRGIVAANIPYYITTPILEKLLNHRTRIERIVLLVQQEVAKRATALPDTPEYGSLSLFVQFQARAFIAGSVSPSVFYPAPEITSSILVLEPLAEGAIAVADERLFFHLVRAAFGQRRKTLLNALLRAPASFELGLTMQDRAKAETLLQLAGIDGGRRGETLSLQEFARIANIWQSSV